MGERDYVYDEAYYAELDLYAKVESRPTCGCSYRWDSFGKLDGISIGEGWIRTDTNPDCKEHYNR